LKFGWNLRSSEYAPPRIEEKVDFNQFKDYKIIRKQIAIPEYA